MKRYCNSCSYWNQILIYFGQIITCVVVKKSECQTTLVNVFHQLIVHPTNPTRKIDNNKSSNLTIFFLYLTKITILLKVNTLFGMTVLDNTKMAKTLL